MEDRRNVRENSRNSGDGTDRTGPVFDVYDDDDIIIYLFVSFWTIIRMLYKNTDEI